MTVRCPTETAICARAYELYVERGRASGHELDDWLQAEYELMQLPLRKIAALAAPKTKPAAPAGRSLVQVVQAALFLGENI
jgi:hypothetical protein